MTKRQRRRAARRARAEAIAARIAVMAAPVPHKCVTKAQTRTQRLKGEARRLKYFLKAVKRGEAVEVPRPTQQLREDMASIGLGASSTKDNALVVRIAELRGALGTAVASASAQRRGQVPGAPALPPPPARRKAGRVVSSAVASPYAALQVANDNTAVGRGGGWQTSALSRPLTSPLRPRTGRAQPHRWSGRGLEEGDDDMASV